MVWSCFIKCSDVLQQAHHPPLKPAAVRLKLCATNITALTSQAALPQGDQVKQGPDRVQYREP